MNREIKFRAKEINTNKWVYGYYIRFETRQICPMGEDKLEDDEIIHLIANETFADWNMPKQLQFTKIDVKTLGQYINMKDRNNYEIYEGDIILHWGREFCQGYYEFNGTIIIYDVTDKYNLEYCENIEVLDNIHDNTELYNRITKEINEFYGEDII